MSRREKPCDCGECAKCIERQERATIDAHRRRYRVQVGAHPPLSEYQKVQFAHRGLLPQVAIALAFCLIGVVAAASPSSDRIVQKQYACNGSVHCSKFPGKDESDYKSCSYTDRLVDASSASAAAGILRKECRESPPESDLWRCDSSSVTCN